MISYLQRFSSPIFSSDPLSAQRGVTLAFPGRLIPFICFPEGIICGEFFPWLNIPSGNQGKGVLHPGVWVTGMIDKIALPDSASLHTIDVLIPVLATWHICSQN